MPHAFELAGSRPARWWGIFSPEGYIELIERFGHWFPQSGPPDGERIPALFRRYDTDLVPPADREAPPDPDQLTGVTNVGS